jgi:hypothetical protein
MLCPVQWLEYAGAPGNYLNPVVRTALCFLDRIFKKFVNTLAGPFHDTRF